MSESYRVEMAFTTATSRPRQLIVQVQQVQPPRWDSECVTDSTGRQHQLTYLAAHPRRPSVP